MMMSPFKIILKPNLQYIPDFENPKNQKGHVISDSFLSLKVGSFILMKSLMPKPQRN